MALTRLILTSVSTAAANACRIFRGPIFTSTAAFNCLKNDTKFASSFACRLVYSPQPRSRIINNALPVLTRHSSTASSAASSIATPPSSCDSSCVYATESVMYPSTWENAVDIEINKAALSPSGDRVDVAWVNGGDVDGSSFPLVWLRDNCRCPQCFNAAAKSRMFPFKNLDVGCSLKEVSKTDDSKNIVITWSDGHTSQYPARWLRCHAFSDSEPDSIVDVPLQLWDASTCPDQIRSFDFNDLLSDDRALYEMLREVKLLGLAVIEGAPLKLRQLHRLAERVGYLLPCHYGETFQVQSKMDPSNAAYTSGDLPMHTDLSYCLNPPGIQMLHCIKQADIDGGENTLVDGFKIANNIRKASPELYDILTKHVVEFYDSGSDTIGDFYAHSRHRVMRLNHKNEVDRIVFSDHGRSAMSRLPVDDVIMTYKAMAAFAAQLYDPANVFEYKMKDGDILIMDNYRVLHGRNAFTMQPDTSRHLEGSYFEWDTVLSKLRVLKIKLEGA